MRQKPADTTTNVANVAKMYENIFLTTTDTAGSGVGCICVGTGCYEDIRVSVEDVFLIFTSNSSANPQLESALCFA